MEDEEIAKRVPELVKEFDEILKELDDATVTFQKAREEAI